MIDFDYASQILDNLIVNFDNRIANLTSLYDKATESYKKCTRDSDANVAKRLDKRFQKICKIINSNDKRQFDKQAKLLNSNHLDAFEKELRKSAKLLEHDDNEFLAILNEMCEDAINDDFCDKLKFVLNYTHKMIDSTSTMKTLFVEQKNFLDELRDNAN